MKPNAEWEEEIMKRYKYEKETSPKPLPRSVLALRDDRRVRKARTRKAHEYLRQTMTSPQEPAGDKESDSQKIDLVQFHRHLGVPRECSGVALQTGDTASATAVSVSHPSYQHIIWAHNMSSTPMTPGTRSGSQEDQSPPLSSPASSPPPMPDSDTEVKEDADYDPRAEAMRKEEERLAKETQRRQKKSTGMNKTAAPDPGADAKNYEKLEWFMSQSKGFSSAIMDQLKQALSARSAETTPQPKLVSGGKMRDYQLEGLTWLACLYEVGLNGILADEMGLGKTVQLISFLAFLREHGTNGPFLILGPLSTVTNWVNEFQRWAPDIPVVMYHGNPQVRGQIRRQQLKGDSRGDKFPVVCTSYEICMRDKKYLANYHWKFIVVDEGHRLKNFNCKLVKELKQYPTESRMILTGTPLQNNLSELWSLLNFLLPEAFSDLEKFEEIFDFTAAQDEDSNENQAAQKRRQETINSLHTILKPFLLRRVKVDVEHNLPKKREYILYAPLTPLQKELYRKIKDGDIRSYLEEKAIERISGVSLNSKSSGNKRKAVGSGKATPNKSTKSSRDSTPASSIRGGRTRAKRKTYAEVSDAQFFKELDDGSSSDLSDAPSNSESESDSKSTDQNIKAARREVSRKALQNPIMQLRLACNSPHHFHYPWQPDQDPDSTLITQSGKMLMLDRLVPYLFKKGHKAILFSQFSRQLDFLEEWATTLHGWNVCRIDGGVKAEDRTEQIDAFNKRKDFKLFLLSTRAGGLGINLTAADTVILYDSDWNPQLDLQAQDRAHRIGQTRPVIVYRLATKGTVEQTLLERADGKRKLEKVVIQKEKFRTFSNKVQDKYGGKKGYDDLAEILEGKAFDEEGWEEGREVLSQRDLETLTDRSEEAYTRAERGEDGGEAFRNVERKGDGGDLLGAIR
ncbi:MAG: hypothetical protein Q9169_007817 [Polycauliona sp. 2 TL-2023]